MLETTRSKIATRMLRLLPVRVARRFVRQQDGAAAIEFAFVALPFLALLFALLETALVFFASQSLEAAAAESARLIMTGQAQGLGYSQDQYKTNVVCNYLKSGVSLFDCSNGVYVSVKSYTNFSAVNTAPPVINNVLNTTTPLPYSPGSPGCIVAVQLYYQWPIYVSLLSDNLSNLTGGNRLLVATAVFRNEPYGPTGPC